MKSGLLNPYRKVSFVLFASSMMLLLPLIIWLRVYLLQATKQSYYFLGYDFGHSALNLITIGCGIVSLILLTVALYYFQQSNLYDKLINGKNLIKFNLDKSIWQEYTKDTENDKGMPAIKVSILIIGVMMGVSILIALAGGTKGSATFLIIMGIISLVIAFAAIIRARIDFNFYQFESPYIIVSSKAIIINDRITILKGLGSQLISINIEKNEKYGLMVINQKVLTGHSATLRWVDSQSLVPFPLSLYEQLLTISKVITSNKDLSDFTEPELKQHFAQSVISKNLLYLLGITIAFLYFSSELLIQKDLERYEIELKQRKIESKEKLQKTLRLIAETNATLPEMAIRFDKSNEFVYFKNLSKNVFGIEALEISETGYIGLLLNISQQGKSMYHLNLYDESGNFIFSKKIKYQEQSLSPNSFSLLFGANSLVRLQSLGDKNLLEFLFDKYDLFGEKLISKKVKISDRGLQSDNQNINNMELAYPEFFTIDSQKSMYYCIDIGNFNHFAAIFDNDGNLIETKEFGHIERANLLSIPLYNLISPINKGFVYCIDSTVFLLNKDLDFVSSLDLSKVGIEFYKFAETNLEERLNSSLNASYFPKMHFDNDFFALFDYSNDETTNQTKVSIYRYNYKGKLIDTTSFKTYKFSEIEYQYSNNRWYVLTNGVELNHYMPKKSVLTVLSKEKSIEHLLGFEFDDLKITNWKPTEKNTIVLSGYSISKIHENDKNHFFLSSLRLD